MPQGSKVLIVDDERPMREMLQLGLEQHGYLVRSLSDGRSLDATIDQWGPDAIVLDVMMPFADGFQLLPSIRRHTQAPVIMLTAKTELDDRLTGLDLGADDYMPKPFAFLELISRLEACLRRPYIASPTILRCEDLVVDVDKREVTRGGKKISLTNKEASLLITLMREPRRVFSKEDLLRLVWGHDFEGEIGNVETYISYLRAKIDAGFTDKLIHTIRGAGYSVRSEK
ncbi:MAG: response regulator transcription factor [Candidatus Eremiobacter antarcticus]|nr:response regulator transcription factor [Candidatus Eremiobacteraeota bacterium]